MEKRHTTKEKNAKIFFVLFGRGVECSVFEWAQLPADHLGAVLQSVEIA